MTDTIIHTGKAGKLSQTEMLGTIFRHMLSRYGPQHWWPADDSFEVMVGAILTQSASWSNVEKAINNLRAARLLTPEAIRSIPEPELAAIIRPSGYYNSKAKKLKALVAWLGNYCNDNIPDLSAHDVAQLRRALLAVHGVGLETADSILLYACNMPVFVVDAYTVRIMDRLDIRPSAIATGSHGRYASWQSLFTDNLPRDAALFNEYHALLVRHGKDCCRKMPLCEACCLSDTCPYPASRGYVIRARTKGTAPTAPKHHDRPRSERVTKETSECQPEIRPRLCSG